MFDNLRNESENSFYEEPKSAQFQPASNAPASSSPARKNNPKFLGMTAVQRFVIAFMVMAAVIILGFMCLLITGKMLI